jgi:hypothetical protein
MLKKRRAKGSSSRMKEGRKQPANESNMVKKENAYSRLQGLLLQKEKVKSV